ncbi:cysteine desulfurase family protein [Sphingosinicella microcystinivorans]|uniref:cysteine desulfurase family protein n=1 Tax=Sphingosinicella microcystinivorans TaxID=335406 RepID=UPI0022F3AFCE|nr:cysteine desulfurase family protein [Sphingosinicella microcystinivorans]WBX83969.1 cysteine desulfurase family protein [Sphingosinicella microcystinivorans]
MNIYLDYQATTPADPAVVAAMQPFWTQKFGNPHSNHRYGWEAEAAVDVARGHIARVLNVQPETVVFTSGATEANNLALKGVMARADRRRLVTVSTEHSCVLETARFLESRGFDLTVLGVGSDGLVDLAALQAALGEDVALVSVMAVNNEIGVIQPLGRIAAAAHDADALFHCDAAQGFGKIPLDMDALGIDLMSLSAHKIYGPKGIGALVVRSGLDLEPQMHGGGQEGDGLRSGTLAAPLAVGFGKAAEIAAARMDKDRAHAEALWGAFLAALHVPHAINGSTAQRWRGNINLRFEGLDGDRLIADLRRVSISSGAACASAKGRHSHVLEALGLSRVQAKASLRIGWGRFSTEDEVRAAAAMIGEAVLMQRKTAA